MLLLFFVSILVFFVFMFVFPFWLDVVTVCVGFCFSVVCCCVLVCFSVFLFFVVFSSLSDLCIMLGPDILTLDGFVCVIF